MTAQLIIHGVLCDEIAKKDKRIKVIHQKNYGVSIARNVGIKNATGKYIGFVDSDDLISNRMYEFMYKSIIESKSRISMCNYCAFKKNTPQFDEIYKTEIMSTDEVIKELMKDRKVRNFAWNKLFDIGIFKNINFIEGKKYEDLGTIFKLFLEVENVVYVNMKLYGYYIREASLTGNYNIDTTLDFIEMIRYRYEYLMREKPNLSKYINMNRVNIVARYFIDIAKSKKISVLKNSEFKSKLYKELEIAKKLNTREIRKINTRELNILNKILFFNPYIFYFIIKNILTFTCMKK